MHPQTKMKHPFRNMRTLLIAALIVSASALRAQLIRIEPADPPVNVPVTVYFNAAEGNKVLKDYTGDVYLHSGLITNKSIDSHDWKYTIGNWGKEDQKVLMQREGPNLYSFRLQINSFYPVGPEDQARQLAFVFRNADGTLVAKTAENEDITIPVNGYKPPIKIAGIIKKENRRLVSLNEVPGGWDIHTDQGMVMIRPYSATVVGVTFSPNGREFQDSSHAVIMKPGIVFRKTGKSPAGHLLESGDFMIYANNQPYYLAFIYKGDTLLREDDGFFDNPGNRGVRFRLDRNETVYGAGERAVPLDRRGYRFPLYNRPSYGYEKGAAMLNYSIPLTFSSKKYMLLFDNPQKGYVDIGKTDPAVQEWGAMGGTLRYFVLAGPDWPAITNSYTALTGRQPLPPRWAMGNLQSRMAYRNQKETDSIVTLMQKKKFPLDAIILDFYWFGDSIQGHLGNLDWYRKAWPDPVGMIAKFRKEGVKTILITEPYVIDTVKNWNDAASNGVFVTDSLGKPYIDKQFYFGAGSLIDIFKPVAREWFWQKYRKQIDNGVAAWWGDLGEPESHPSDIYHITGKADEVHNIYGHYWDKMLFDKYKQYYPGTRLFHLQRSGFAGSQRFAAYPWTGDVSRSWGGYQAQLPLLLTMSMSGLAYIHSDAGGFAQGVKDDELYTRWLQFAVFTPVLRPHGSGLPSEPVYWSEKTQKIVRSYMNLRYTMLPYNYSLAWENAAQGSPLMRPLFYSFQEDTTARHIGDQYLWGDNLMVAPVQEKGQASRKIYFPAGNWFDFNTGIEYSGSQWIDYPLTLENIPVFARAGSFIPMTKPLSTTDNYKADNYMVRYYPGDSSSFVQYEDDGLDNLALQTNNYERITYSGKQGSQKTTIRISSQGNFKGMPAERKMEIQVRKKGLPSKVSLNGKVLLLNQSPKPGSSGYQVKDGWIKILFTWKNEPVSIEITESKSMR